MERFVYKPDYAKLLLGMIGNDSSVADLAKMHGSNSGHLRIVLDQWIREEVVLKTRVKNEHFFSLTRKGVLLAETFGVVVKISKSSLEELSEEIVPQDVVEREKQAVKDKAAKDKALAEQKALEAKELASQTGEGQ